MRAIALRGFCLSVGKHAVPGDEVDVSESTFQFLRSIGAVEAAPEAPPVETPASPESEPEPATSAESTKPGKRAAGR